MNQRDRNLVVAQGLRKGLVTTGVLGSLGFATVAALSTGGTASVGASPANPSANHVPSGARHASRQREPGNGPGTESGDDDQSTRPTRPRRPRAPSVVTPRPQLQPGSGGAPQATTSGS